MFRVFRHMRPASNVRRAAALLLWMAAIGAGFGAGGCGSDDTLKAPKSDTQYDDGDDPGTGGVIGAVDAATRDAAYDGPCLTCFDAGDIADADAD